MYPKTLKSYITNPRVCSTAKGSSREYIKSSKRDIRLSLNRGLTLGNIKEMNDMKDF